LDGETLRHLLNKQIILGVTGGIAAYKSADLARRLREAGATVRVAMTVSAQEFITPLTLQAVSGQPVHVDLFDLNAEAAMGHIELARWADAVIIAPASADFIARLAGGEANDILTTLCLATTAPIAIAPSMNQAMWKNTLTQDNLQVLRGKNIAVFGPGEGSQACGDVGPGRMQEPLDIVKHLGGLFDSGVLADKHVVITAGPTREMIDPVRFISNGSSGKMGYALACAARDAGAEVTLISGPVALAPPSHVKIIDVISAADMLAAVKEQMPCDIFFSVAAVADYRVNKIATEKIPKNEAELTLRLELNPDIVATVAALKKRPIVIGFAAETHNLMAHAQAKLKNKKLDMIIANQVGQPGSGMNSDDNQVTVFWQDQHQTFPKTSKQKLARDLIALCAGEYFTKQTS
jgi:phosphopantothenoylcysteine decarboxylase/phosphopantothenate--cysteine ligase